MTLQAAVFGAGALGSLVAARLAHRGSCALSIVARGAQLDAIRSEGIRIIEDDRETLVRPGRVVAPGDDLPPQDLVVVVLKSCSLPAAAAYIAAIMKPEGRAIFVLNGIPWWYGAMLPEGRALPLLDPRSLLESNIGTGRTIGCVTYAGARIESPGTVRIYGTNRWLLGSASGDVAPLEMPCGLFRQAGLEAQPVADFRPAVWRKLMLNLPLNPLCALTRLSTREMLSDPQLHATARALVEEVLPIAAAHGCDLAGEIDLDALLDPEARPAGARPSMLQDVEAGRPMEVEAILGQVEAFGRELAIATPTVTTVLALVRGLDRQGRPGE